MAKEPTNFSKQFNYIGEGYIDAKMGPVANLTELETFIDPFEIKEGMTVVVLDDGNGNPADYWYINDKWQRKTATVPLDGDDCDTEIQK